MYLKFMILLTSILHSCFHFLEYMHYESLKFKTHELGFYTYFLQEYQQHNNTSFATNLQSNGIFIKQNLRSLIATCNHSCSGNCPLELQTLSLF